MIEKFLEDLGIAPTEFAYGFGVSYLLLTFRAYGAGCMHVQDWF